MTSRVLINTVLSEHASAAWGGDPKKPLFWGRGGACRPLMTGLAGVEKTFSTPCLGSKPFEDASIRRARTSRAPRSARSAPAARLAGVTDAPIVALGDCDVVRACLDPREHACGRFGATSRSGPLRSSVRRPGAGSPPDPPRRTPSVSSLLVHPPRRAKRARGHRCTAPPRRAGPEAKRARRKIPMPGRERSHPRDAAELPAGATLASFGSEDGASKTLAPTTTSASTSSRPRPRGSQRHVPAERMTGQDQRASISASARAQPRRRSADRRERGRRRSRALPRASSPRQGRCSRRDLESRTRESATPRRRRRARGQRPLDERRPTCSRTSGARGRWCRGCAGRGAR